MAVKDGRKALPFPPLLLALDILGALLLGLGLWAWTAPADGGPLPVSLRFPGDAQVLVLLGALLMLPLLIYLVRTAAARGAGR